MDDFDKLLNSMVADVKAGKFKKKRTKKKKQVDGKEVEVSYAINPWDDEALVLMATNTICDRCGNDSMSWNQSLYIERVNRKRRDPITLIERLDQCNYAAVYGGLPKRVEVITQHSCTCPQCFGIGDNRADALTGNMTPVQMVLDFGEKQ